MPQCLEEFLGELSAEDREAVWQYLDGNADALDSMIAIVAE